MLVDAYPGSNTSFATYFSGTVATHMGLSCSASEGLARSGGPNPSPDCLEVCGHWATLAQTPSTGPWQPVDAGSPSLRLLQWNGTQVPFDNAARCTAVGIPLGVLVVHVDKWIE